LAYGSEKWSPLEPIQGGGGAVGGLVVGKRAGGNMVILARDETNVLQALEEVTVGKLASGEGWGGWECFSDEVCVDSVSLARTHDNRLVACVRDSSGDLLHKWTPRPKSPWCIEDWAEGTPHEPCDAAVAVVPMSGSTALFTVSRGQVHHAEWGPGAAVGPAAWRSF